MILERPAAGKGKERETYHSPGPAPRTIPPPASPTPVGRPRSAAGPATVDGGQQAEARGLRDLSGGQSNLLLQPLRAAIAHREEFRPNPPPAPSSDLPLQPYWTVLRQDPQSQRNAPPGPSTTRRKTPRMSASGTDRMAGGSRGALTAATAQTRSSANMPSVHAPAPALPDHNLPAAPSAMGDSDSIALPSGNEALGTPATAGGLPIAPDRHGKQFVNAQTRYFTILLILFFPYCLHTPNRRPGLSPKAGTQLRLFPPPNAAVRR